MQRIQRVDIDRAPAGSRPVLDEIKAKVGRVPNIYLSMAHSPAALRALTGMSGAMEGAVLGAKAREAVALRIGEYHGCHYCLAAHTAISKKLSTSADDAIGFRKGAAADPKIKAVLDLAEAILEKRGEVSDEEVGRARKAGVSDAEIVEIVALVALNTYTNYINAVVKTDIDFPAAPPLG